MSYAAFHPNTVVVTRPSLEDLQSLGAKRPSSVTIFEYAFDSMQPLGALAGIEELKLQDSGELRTLSGTDALASLTNLVISTPPAWDGTNR